MLSLSVGSGLAPGFSAETSGSEDKSTSCRSSRWYKNASIHGMEKIVQFWEGGAVSSTFLSDPLPSSFMFTTEEFPLGEVSVSADELSKIGDKIRLDALCFS